MKRMASITLLLLLLVPGPSAFAQAARGKAPAIIKPVMARAEQERTIEDSELKPVAAQPCKSESSLKSLNGDTPTFLRFKNKTTGDLTYYWINYEGKRDQARTIKPGEDHHITTFLTHPFVLVNAKGECRAVYMPRKEYGLVVITEVPK